MQSESKVSVLKDVPYLAFSIRPIGQPCINHFDVPYKARQIEQSESKVSILKDVPYSGVLPNN